MSGSGSPGITLTPEESRSFGQLFKQYDRDGTGVILGETARPLFEGSGLPAKVLGQVWQLADTENRGFLDQVGFSKALRVLYHVQNGQPLSARLMTIPSGLPQLDQTGNGAGSASGAAASTPSAGYGAQSSGPQTATASGPQTSQTSQSTGQQGPAQPPVQSSQSGQAGQTPQITGPNSGRIPPLSTADKQRFSTLFDRSASGSTIDGAAAKDIFVKARLPNDVLGKIWNLVDVQGRGSLTRNEFVLAMHLIQSTITRTLPAIPASLPQGWLPWLEGGAAATPGTNAASGAPGAVVNHTGSGSISSIRELQEPQTTGQTGLSWVMTPHQRAQYNSYFDSLDTAHTGTVGAAEVVPFLTKSRLSEEVLAQVWDLADLQGQGTFDRTDFALAMYLVQAKLAGYELPETVPQTLVDSARAEGPRAGSPRVGSPRLPSNPVPPQATGSRPHPPATRQTTGPASGSAAATPQATSSLTDLAALDDYFKPMEPERQTGQGQTGQPQGQSQNQPQGQPQSQQQGQSRSISGPGSAPGATGATGASGPTGASGAPGRGSVSEAPRFVPTSSFGQSLVQKSAPNTQHARSMEQARGEAQQLAEEADKLQQQVASTAVESKNLDEELAGVLERKNALQAQIAALRQKYDSEASRVHQSQQQLREAQAAIGQLEKDQRLRESGFKALQTQFDNDQSKLKEATSTKESLEKQLAEIEQQHTTHQKSLEALHTDNEHLRGVTDGHTQHIAALDAQLRQVLDQLDAAKATRDELEAKARQAKEHSDRMAAELVSAQQQHQQYLAEAEQHAQAIKASEAQAASHAAQAAELRSQQASASARTSGTSGQASQASGQGTSGTSGPSSTREATAPSAAPAHSGTKSGGAIAGITAAVAGVAGAAGAAIGAATSGHTHSAPGGATTGAPSAGTLSPTSTRRGTLTNDTPHTSPPTSSEFPGDADPQQIPSFTLPMARPQSATSSVANNPPQSVRGDYDVSQPQSPAFPTSEPISGLVQPETLELTASSAPSDEDSFEFVDAGDGRDDSRGSKSGKSTPARADPSGHASTGPGSGPGAAPASAAGSGPGSTATSAAAESSRTGSTGSAYTVTGEPRGPEFPPIQELGLSDESDSDELTEVSAGQTTTEAVSSHLPGGLPGGFSHPEQPKSSTTSLSNPPSYGERKASLPRSDASDSFYDEPVTRDTPSSFAFHDSQGQAQGQAPAQAPAQVHAQDRAPTQTQTQAPAPAQHQSQTFPGQSQTFAGQSQTGSFPGGSQPKAKPRDDFANAFDDLEETNEDADDDDFSGFGNGPSVPATPQPAAGPDEWQQLFADPAPGQPSAHAPSSLSAEESAVQELTSMGFGHADSLAALKQTGFNLTEATNILLDQN